MHFYGTTCRISNSIQSAQHVLILWTILWELHALSIPAVEFNQHSKFSYLVCHSMDIAWFFQSGDWIQLMSLVHLSQICTKCRFQTGDWIQSQLYVHIVYTFLCTPLVVTSWVIEFNQRYVFLFYTWCYGHFLLLTVFSIVIKFNRGELLICAGKQKKKKKNSWRVAIVCCVLYGYILFKEICLYLTRQTIYEMLCTLHYVENVRTGFEYYKEISQIWKR